MGRSFSLCLYMIHLFSQSKTFIQYCIVGVSATLVDVISLYVLVEYVHLPILLGSFFAFLVAVLESFILNKYWTFKNNDKNIRKQLIKFFIVATIGLGLTLFFMFILTHVFSIQYIIAKLCTSVLVLTWNFIGNKHWSFKEKREKPISLKNYTCELSIVIPAYNEEVRVIPTIHSVDAFCKKENITHEIIVVDDGSKDKTSEVVQDLQKEISNLHVISFEKNQGKGAAIQAGIMKSTGKYILFTDADNSTPIEEFKKFQPALEKTPIVIGSRYIEGSNIQLKQSKFRVMLGRMGNILIQLFLLDGIKDTQCGFKAFWNSVAQDIFSRMKTKRFGFDMEILAIARLRDCDIEEIPVRWINSPDSRVRPVKDALKTLKELIYIKLNLLSGRYK